VLTICPYLIQIFKLKDSIEITLKPRTQLRSFNQNEDQMWLNLKFIICWIYYFTRYWIIN